MTILMVFVCFSHRKPILSTVQMVYDKGGYSLRTKLSAIKFLYFSVEFQIEKEKTVLSCTMPIDLGTFTASRSVILHAINSC